MLASSSSDESSIGMRYSPHLSGLRAGRSVMKASDAAVARMMPTYVPLGIIPATAQHSKLKHSWVVAMIAGCGTRFQTDPETKHRCRIRGFRLDG